MAQGKQDDLERAFDLIKKGRAQGAEGQHWAAAGSFLEARVVLEQLAKDHPTENEEEEKIQKLYQDQSAEYFFQSRESLIAAMQEEAQEDKEEKSIKCQELSAEEAKKRNQLFIDIFSLKDQEEIVTKQEHSTSNSNPDDNKKVLEKQLSLEERLSQLNANLPKGFKSSQERMQDLNQGMKRLGLGAYTTSISNNNNNNASNPLKIEPPKSTSQQVEDIIAQAKDEVAMQVPDNDVDAEVDEASNNDSIGLSDDDYLSDDGVDSLLSDEVAQLQNVSQIKDAIASTQASLAELLALIQPLGEDESELEEDDNAREDGNFDPSYGKQKLKDAKTTLQEALKLWKVQAKRP